MFNVAKFMKAISHKDLGVRLEAVRSLERAPRSLVKMLRELARLDREWSHNDHWRKPLEVFFDHLEESFLISERRIPHKLRHEEMNQGKTMSFHPSTGDALTSLKLHSYNRTVHYAADTTGGEWGSGRGAHTGIKIENGTFFWKGKRKLRRICPDETKKGDPYPAHWKYDPWTGEKL